MMNKPTLNVLGRKQTLIGVIVEDEFGSRNTFLDRESFEHGQADNKVDLSQLINEEIHNESLATLNAHLEESEQHLQELKVKIAHEVLASDFGNLTQADLASLLKTLKNLSKEHHDHNEYIDGVAASIELLKGRMSNE